MNVLKKHKIKRKNKKNQKKKINGNIGKEFYTHVHAIFKDPDKEKDKFLEEAQNAGF